MACTGLCAQRWLHLNRICCTDKDCLHWLVYTLVVALTAPPGSSVFAAVREPACYLLSYGDNQLLNPRENVGQDDSTSLSLLHCLGNMRHDNMILLYLRSVPMFCFNSYSYDIPVYCLTRLFHFFFANLCLFCWIFWQNTSPRH